MFKPMFETLYHIILRQLSSGNLSPVHYSFLSKVPRRHTSLQTAPLVWYGSEATESVHRRRGVDLQRPLAQHRLQGLCLHTTEITKKLKATSQTAGCVGGTVRLKGVPRMSEVFTTTLLDEKESINTISTC